MMKNIFIYPNLRKDSARDILQPVCDQLRRDGVRLMLPKQMRVVPPIIEDADYMKTEDAVQFADMAVVLGGDGTMLRLAREAAQNQLPLLGINVGHVGFMTELEPAELPEMEKLFTGEFSLDSRMMLHVAVRAAGVLCMRTTRSMILLSQRAPHSAWCASAFRRTTRRSPALTVTA